MTTGDVLRQIELTHFNRTNAGCSPFMKSNIKFFLILILFVRPAEP